MPYARLFLAGFRRRTTYRLAILAGVVTNSSFGLIRCAVLVAMAGAAAGGSTAAGAGGPDGVGVLLGGYDTAGLLAYAWITQALLGPVNIWSGTDLRDRVRSGDIAVDLARPIDVQGALLAHDAGYSLAAVIPRSIPTLLIGVLVVGVRLPTAASVWLAGLVSIVLAVVVSYLARFLLQSAAFWITETRGLLNLYAGAAGIFSGLIMPLAIMPDGLRALAYATPFPALIQIPADVLGGRALGADALGLLGVQLLWLVVLAVAGRFALAAGSRRLVVAGG